MNDVYGNELSLGDEVAYVTAHYSGLKLGIVLGFTPKGITVCHERTPKHLRNEQRYRTNRSSDQV